MKPLSRTYIVLTVIAIIAIGWLLVTQTKRSMPIPPTTSTTTPVEGMWPSVSIDKKTISDTNQYYSIDAIYPVTKDDRITTQFQTFVEGQIAQFKDDTSWATDGSTDSAAEGNLSLDVSYREQKSLHADTYVFDISTYTGGAHGLQVTRTFGFDQHGKALMIADLFTNGEAGLKTIAPFVQKELTKKNISDAKWIADGAAPTTDNYQSFIVSDDGITFVFDAYQVAPYAAGVQNILVPTSVFKSIANPDLFK